MNVIRALCENFWDGLHPRIEGTDVEFRIAPLVWINQRLVVDLKLSPITAPDSDNFPKHTWADWENACLNEKNGAANESRAVTIAKFQQGAMLTPTLHLHSTLEATRRLFLAAEQLDALLDQKLKRDAPGLSPIKTLAGSIAGLLASVLEQRGEPLEPAPAKYEPKGVAKEPAPASDVLSYGYIRSRAQAYQMLAEAADFLVRTEPHSPVPYLVRRAISWGAMSLETLMSDLIRKHQRSLGNKPFIEFWCDAQKPKPR